MKQVNETNLNSAEYWDDVYVKERDTDKRRIDQDRLGYLVSQLQKYRDHNPHEQTFTLLDVGCGDGELLRFVHAYLPTWKKEGVDITPKAVEYARTDNPQMVFKVGNVYDLPYQDDSFNIVFCGETLEHLENPNEAIKQLFRVCKLGGYIIISTPNEHSNYSEEHINEFTVGDCLALTSKYGQVIYDDIRVVCNGISVIWVTKNG